MKKEYKPKQINVLKLEKYTIWRKKNTNLKNNNYGNSKQRDGQ